MEEDSEGNQNRAVLCLNIKSWILKFEYIFWKVIFTTLDRKFGNDNHTNGLKLFPHSIYPNVHCMVPFDLLQKWNVSPVIFSEDCVEYKLKLRYNFMSITMNLSEITIFRHLHCNSGHSSIKFKNWLKISNALNTLSNSCFITLQDKQEMPINE
jgi:hypothetical protein